MNTIRGFRVAAAGKAQLDLSSPGSGLELPVVVVAVVVVEINCDDNFCESFFTAPRLSLRSAIKRRRPVVPAFASSHPSHPLTLRSGWRR